MKLKSVNFPADRLIGERNSEGRYGGEESKFSQTKRENGQRESGTMKNMIINFISTAFYFVISNSNRELGPESPDKKVNAT